MAIIIDGSVATMTVKQYNFVVRERDQLKARVEEAERMLAVRVDDEKGLVTENKRLREQNNPCRGHMEDYPEGVCWLCEIKRLREAMEFYAEPDTYEGGSQNDWTGEEPVLKDGGDRASAALKEKP
jgi:hypothetical protein